MTRWADVCDSRQTWFRPGCVHPCIESALLFALPFALLLQGHLGNPNQRHTCTLS